jgi:hypothetical protein
MKAAMGAMGAIARRVTSQYADVSGMETLDCHAGFVTQRNDPVLARLLVSGLRSVFLGSAVFLAPNLAALAATFRLHACL